jgi:hypothetical protein
VVTASPGRALVAAGLLAALLAALLGAWFTSGWADVRSRQRAVRDAPRLEADERGAGLAHELRGALAAVMAREALRPYFHYQNLVHDPRTSAVGVAPSPLAQGSRDPLVLGYFQLDGRSRATTPTINDELPELSEPAHLADHRRFRDEVTRSLAGELAPRATGPLVAQRAPPAARPPVEDQAQVVELDPSSYAQNALADPARSIATTVSPLEWRTLRFAGQPTLVAVRQVETPDGRLAQGFVVDRTSVTSWLATHAGDAVAELRTGDGGSGGAEIAPDWHLEVAPNPRAAAAAVTAATAVARGFIATFVAVAVIAVAAALLVVMLVAPGRAARP